MKLISCSGCGVVLDMDKIVFPDVFDENGDYNEGCSEWDGEKYVAIIHCPVCDHIIGKE